MDLQRVIQQKYEHSKCVCKIAGHIPYLNIDMLKQYVLTYITSRKEYYADHKSNLEIESCFSEWWLEKCTGGVHIGNGCKAIDVLVKNIGIDCVTLCINGNITNEKSVIQNFKTCGNQLDNSFKDKKDNDVVSLFKRELNSKLELTCKEHTLTYLYYAVFISNKENVYFVPLLIDIKLLANITSGGFTKAKCSINVLNFIHKDFGSAKIYKSKKRLELRFSKNILKYAIKLY